MIPIPSSSALLAIFFGALVAAAAVQTYRLKDAHSKLELIRVAGEAAREMTRMENAARDHITRKADEAQKATDLARERALADLRERLRNPRPGRVPAVPGATGGDPAALECFDGRRLREGMVALIARGAESIDAANFCAAWAVEQHNLRREQ